MVIFRSPPPVARQGPLALPKPRIEHSQQPNSSFNADASTSISMRPGSLPNASVPSTPSQHTSLYPSLPTATPNTSQHGLRRPPPPPADDFPSLDEMAQVQRQKNESNGRNTSFTSSSSASASRTYTASTSSSSRPMPSSSTTVQVPSSLPRPNKARTSLSQGPVTRRSSLTAIEAARQRAGDETPTAVTHARAQSQQAGTHGGTSTGDDSNDTSNALVAGPNGAVSANISIDLESGKLPMLRRPSTSKRSSDVGTRSSRSSMVASTPAQEPVDPPFAGADLSTASQRSRRNGEDRPISSGYDFSKYLEQGIDPFNAASRKEMRRESRPLPVPVSQDADDGEMSRDASRSYSRSGDDTLRGDAILPPSKQSARPLPPPIDDAASAAPNLEHGGQDRSGQGGIDVEDQQPTPKAQPPIAARGEASVAGRSVSSSMGPPSQLPRPQFKMPALPASQPAKMAPPPVPMQSTPRATPQAGTRKINHLSGFSVPGVPSVAVNGAPASQAGDESTVSASAQKRRLDPAARTDRLMSLELAEAKKKVKLLSEKLEVSEDQQRRTMEESEGWASEAARLEDDVARLRSQLEDEATQVHRATLELEAKVVQHKLDADERQWRLLCEKRNFTELESDLVYCRNETTYESYRAKEIEANLLMEKDDLRIRLMAERKRSDVLAVKLKGKLRETVQLRKRLSARAGDDSSLRSHNERLSSEVEVLQADVESLRTEASDLRKQLAAASSKTPKQTQELEELRRDNAEMQEDIATYVEREEMMAETRKAWKKERREMQAQIRELEAQLEESLAQSEVPKAAKKRSAAPAAHLDDEADALSDESLAAAPVAQGTKRKGPLAKARRDPMQGASDAVPSEAEVPLSSPSHKAARKVKKASAPSALARAALVASSKQSQRKPSYRDDNELSDAASDYGSEQLPDDDYEAPAPAKKSSTAKKGAKTKAATAASTATAAKGKRAKAPVAVEYDEYTADPSATPMIRTKRSMEEMMAEAEEADAAGEVEDSFRGPSPNTAPSMGSAATKAMGPNDAGGPPQKKKKRKLLGSSGGAVGGGAPGLMAWASRGDENGGLQPDYNIPLELSPIKPAAGGGRLGGMFNGLGTGRGPFG
ncbi:uncharacterized protein PFL1_01096 [Pseudozyma flocculosa PF-1]|uniref:uncharacterized protein n=1 Tax=Pseudozyma flocculosa PF-1 TaxID=1277687 RepID=UPI000456148C|nr:uncharacterized protein PFL1_01096 [Pseudozyma flocculosa PF-1]EPQ31764.1 hypothetical protein PFL1_01096 [Pseudozyma flocculosa PF-1]